MVVAVDLAGVVDFTEEDGNLMRTGLKVHLQTYYSQASGRSVPSRRIDRPEACE
ncbi:hypothetical protein SAMN05216327_11282 [Dyadobacter sp. SG02]|nr:hypothetical protein SAMN05216327_11282 [Dyadobacter sp. SG02]